MQILQKLHLSNRLYIEQVTCHLLMPLLSSRACSETAKQNSVCLEIMPNTSQVICVGNCLTAFFPMRELRGFQLISGWGVFLW